MRCLVLASQTIRQVVCLCHKSPFFPLIFRIVDASINNAILRYSGADDVEPTTTATTSVNPLVEANLVVIIEYYS